MPSLTQQDVLQIWETGLTQHPLDRALTILAAADPEQSLTNLAALTIGQRDRRLLTLLEQTFGPSLASYDGCPACRESIEFVLNTSDLQLAPALDGTPETYSASLEGYDLQFRLPTSLDLTAISRLTDLEAARRLLAERCLIEARRHGADIPYETLPEAVITALAAQMAACDLQAEIDLSLACPACGHQWSILFEVATFLWTEICVLARRLFQEVHTLALAYGWSESQILALSPTRRQAYLELVFNG